MNTSIATTAKIVKQVQEGARWSELLARGYQHQLVMKSMCLRPQRKGQTFCMYLYGPTGTGKTSAVFQTLNMLEQKFKSRQLNAD